ncbi:MAG: hypothetical protein U0930_01805 [Pirellulales bacterium]
MIGRIPTIQEMLGDSLSNLEELEQLTAIELINLLEQLQVRMRNRQT